MNSLASQTKRSAGWLLAVGSIVYGIIGVALELLGNLPPGIDFDFRPALIAIVAIVIQTLGFADEIESGKKSILEKLALLFKNPYRGLALAMLFVLLRGLVAIPTFDPTYAAVAKILLSLLAVLKLEGGAATLRALVTAKRAGLTVRAH